MSTPLHQQIETELRSRLRKLVPGDRLLPEPELAASLGVSRTTLRQALARLEDAGLIHRRPGAGTVVARPSLDQPLGGTVTLRQAASAVGFDLTPILEGVELLTPTEGPLELASATQPLLWLRRTFTHDGENVAREVLWLDDADAARLHALIGIDPTASVYDFLALTGRTPRWSHEVLRVDVPDDHERRLLGSHPVLRLRRVSGTDAPHEVRELALRGDQVRLSARWGDAPDGAPFAGADG